MIKHWKSGCLLHQLALNRWQIKL